MIWPLFAIVYAAVALIALLGVIKYTSIEAGHVRKYALRVRTSISRFLLLTKVLKLLLAKPASVLAVIALIIIILIPATAASYSYVWVASKVRNPVNDYVIHIEFSKVVRYDEVISEVMEHIGGFIRSCSSYLRVVLEEPLNLSTAQDLIYVVVGVDEELLKELTGRADVSGCIVCSNAPQGVIVEENGIKLLCVSPSKLTSATLIDDEPLLPVQAYVGVKPVLPPPKNVVILRKDRALRLLNMTYDGISDVVIILNSYIPPHTLRGIISELSDIKSLKYYLTNGTVLIYSTIPLPTERSIIVALIASLLASVIIVSIYTSLLPEIKLLYDRLAIQGMPPWGITLIIAILTSTTILGVGIVETAIIYSIHGGVSAFTSLITSAIVWISAFSYLNKKSKPKSLLTDVYAPVTRRYDLAIKDAEMSIDELVNIVCEIIRSNEFFIVDEISAKIHGSAAYIHARLHYTETWGSGLDLNITIGRNSEFLVSISATPWGIEEISEAVVQTMMSLAISRVVGGVRAWVYRV